ncbi:MAG: methionyl-tRNA formyltransferase [Rickettsiales bacterium]
MDKNHGKTLGFAGCRVTTRDAMANLIANGYTISYLLTISPEDAENTYHISGYEDLQPFAEEHGIKVYHVKDYKLKTSDEDRKAITEMGLDALIVLGWQRVIPKWVLDLLPIGAMGMHGGPKLPPFGRGHSVMNWSLIEGRGEFLSYLFFYLEKVDAGPIIGTCKYDINPWDTCETLHFKYQLSMGRLLIENLPNILSGDFTPTPQSNQGATYYPKRTPEDGHINWNLPVEQVHNLIRGVTHPYPGAFTMMGDKKLMVWRAQPFDSKLTWNKEPGTIVEVFYNGKAVVQARDFGLLIHDYEGHEFTPEDKGKLLA